MNTKNIYTIAISLILITTTTGFAQTQRQNGWSAEISGGISLEKKVSDKYSDEFYINKHYDFNFRAGGGYRFMLSGGLFVKPMVFMSYNKTYYPNIINKWLGVPPNTLSTKFSYSKNNHFYSFRMGIDATIGYNFIFNDNTSLDLFGGLIYSYDIAQNNKGNKEKEYTKDVIDLFKNNFCGELGLALNYKNFYYKFFVEFPFTYYYQYKSIYDKTSTETFKERNTCSFNLGVGYNF